MPEHFYLPIFELTRGGVVECVHYGSFTVVNTHGELLASFGGIESITFLRSSAKPFQLMPFIEKGGHEYWNFTEREIAILCASHTGTDDHFAVLKNIQKKIDITQDDLRCGIHPPIDMPTYKAMIERGEECTPNRHNCSGKHTGMLAFAKYINADTTNYIDKDHPIQKEILECISEISGVDKAQIHIGIDGCSAPVFALPLRKAAQAYARLCDPVGLPKKRMAACRTITHAMINNPDMVSGPGKFDTRLMEVAKGKIICKGGAQGMQQVGIMPGVIEPTSPGIGIALKISDGDREEKVRPAVILKILQNLNALTLNELDQLSDFGPEIQVRNWRNLVVGKGKPLFSL